MTKAESTIADADQILIYMLEMRYLSLDQIIKKFYDEGRVEERLKDLLSTKQIEMMGKDLEVGSVAKVSKLGFEQLTRKYPKLKFPPREKSYFKPRLKHDLMLNELRIRFEELGFIKKWLSEVRMRDTPLFMRTFRNYPDAVCKKRNDKGYFLELEMSGKGPGEYKKRIEEYQVVLEKEEFRDAQIEGVIFFCESDKTMEKIKSGIPEGVKNISVQRLSKYFPENFEFKKGKSTEPRLHA